MKNTTHPIERAVAKYIALRDEKKSIQERHKKELEDINEQMQLIESKMQDYMLRSGQQNAKTKAGTAYLSTTTRAKIEDWEAFKAHMVEEELFDMVEHRVSNDAVNEYVESTGSTPPGVSIVRTTRCLFKK